MTAVKINKILANIPFDNMCHLLFLASFPLDNMLRLVYNVCVLSTIYMKTCKLRQILVHTHMFPFMWLDYLIKWPTLHR